MQLQLPQEKVLLYLNVLFWDGLISGLVIIQFRDICCCILDACLPEKSEKDFILQKIIVILTPR
jgi:hypothetical protein